MKTTRAAKPSVKTVEEMPREIKSYPFPSGVIDGSRQEPFTMELPRGAVVLDMKEATFGSRLIALVDPNGPAEERRFVVHTVGSKVPSEAGQNLVLRASMVWGLFPLYLFEFTP
jgi:hypothetical protein